MTFLSAVTTAMAMSAALGSGGGGVAVGDTLVDPVAALVQEIEEGRVVLDRDASWGYLPSLLEALDIPVSSQSLVFSRTSLQVDMIAPWSPRAIYFNDDVYVGYTVDGLVLEIASVDPDGGTVFYTLDQQSGSDGEPRRDDLTCKACHSTGMTGGVSGVLMRSYLTDRMGYPVAPLDERPTDDRTPMEMRFGGWYVTGSHSKPHAGNTRAQELTHEIDDPERYVDEFDMNTDGNVTALEDRFDTGFYLTNTSDIVALSVLAHQTRVHNLITLAGRVAEEALREQELNRLISGEEADTTELSQATENRIDYAVQSLVRGVLFHRAAPTGRIDASGDYAADFVAMGPTDARGRSLRQLSGDGRLFEYPLSFLIYSEAWDSLPDIVRGRAYRMITDLLTGDDDPEYPVLTAENRRATFEILRETKPEFAEFVREEIGSPDTTTGDSGRLGAR